MSAGKGDKTRPCDAAKYRENWDRIFGKKKPIIDKRTTRSISLPPETWVRLDVIAKRKGVSRSECVNRLIEWLGE